MTSSFDDLAPNDQPKSSKSTNKVSWSRKNSEQDINGLDSKSQKATAVTDYFKPGKIISRNKRKNVIETELWADKHAPTCQVFITMVLLIGYLFSWFSWGVWNHKKKNSTSLI